MSNDSIEGSICARCGESGAVCTRLQHEAKGSPDPFLSASARSQCWERSFNRVLKEKRNLEYGAAMEEAPAHPAARLPEKFHIHLHTGASAAVDGLLRIIQMHWKFKEWAEGDRKKRKEISG